MRPFKLAVARGCLRQDHRRGPGGHPGRPAQHPEHPGGIEQRAGVRHGNLDRGPAPAPGGGTTGRPTPGPLILTKSVDRASPKLLRAAFFGEQLTVDISWIMNLAGTPRQTVTIKLEGATITKIDSRAELTGPSAIFGEIVTLSYQKITMTVPTINAQGQVSGTPPFAST
jgi:type VI secretion system Hcp family effector